MALNPLEEALVLWRSESAHKVAASKRPGFIAAMTIILHWPDLTQGQNLVSGYSLLWVRLNLLASSAPSLPRMWSPLTIGWSMQGRLWTT